MRIHRSIGSRSMCVEMLEFAARHHITAQIELFPLSDINAALSRVREAKARYRVVLQALDIGQASAGVEGTRVDINTFQRSKL